MSMRRTILNGLKRMVYEFRLSNKPFQEIVRHVGVESDPASCEKEVRQILNEFVEKKLMFWEKDRYLSLAMPFASFH
jgi:bacterioferritin-associated ferredoxin